MFSYFLSVLAARVAAVLCLVMVLLPYALRGNRVSRKLGLAPQSTSPYLRRLWPHFWVGYLIAGLTVLHVGLAMGLMRRAEATGIWGATAALFMLIFEIVLGLSLKDPGLSRRRVLRRIHFWVMVSFIAALGIHLVFNG